MFKLQMCRSLAGAERSLKAADVVMLHLAWEASGDLSSAFDLQMVSDWRGRLCLLPSNQAAEDRKA
jgi:hypothetical protein